MVEHLPANRDAAGKGYGSVLLRRGPYYSIIAYRRATPWGLPHQPSASPGMLVGAGPLWLDRLGAGWGTGVWEGAGV